MEAQPEQPPLDIDERRRAEEALAASERNLKLIIDTIPALAWSTGPDGSADFFNQHYLDYVGLSAEQVAGWGWTVALHPDDRDGLAAKWQRNMAAGEPGEAEARLRRYDGEYRWFLFRTNPLRDELGNIVKWYGTNTDIDDRKRAEAQRDRTIEELQGQQELLHLAQKSARAMAFDWYLQQEVNAWSPEQEALYGLPPGSFDGTYQGWKKLIYPPDWPLLLKAIKHAHETGEVAVEFRVQWPDGSVHWLATNGRMFFDGRGKPYRMVGFTSDVTPRKLAEEELRRSEALLAEARSELAHVSRVATLGALTASIAHEVNQPLSGIITNASTCLRMLAADPPNVEGARETARRTIRDGHRASDVIRRLRVLFGKKGAPAELVDLNEATREVIALSQSELRKGRVILRDELADDLPPVAGDRVQLQQVILNLLLNASEAMSGVDARPRQLVIKTERDEAERVRLSVRDAGVGFDPQYAERLFDAFYTTKDGGMGIGLSVSRSIIESHHGRLWAAPNDGPGATFSFSIPRSHGAAPDSPGDGLIPAPALTGEERVEGGS
ncbi:MAG TPA: PAS domain-containing protein [Pyrinomonadaceae bacterium]|nr:PAS domain-containing protein [Pyrinomonadaceae bacterium]